MGKQRLIQSGDGGAGPRLERFCVEEVAKEKERKERLNTIS